MEAAAMLLDRELGMREARAWHMPAAVAQKLALSAVLTGHEGCVNRLAWNEDGSLLASGSDDCNVILWPFPDTGRVPVCLRTRHRANLFGVAFLPHCNSTRVVTGAMDHSVQLHTFSDSVYGITPRYRSSSSGTNMPPGGGGMRRHQQRPLMHQVVPSTTVYSCHRGRVKEVKTCADEPSLFWSASEDGGVRQYDIRAPGQKAPDSPNQLLRLCPLDSTGHVPRGGGTGGSAVSGSRSRSSSALVEAKGLDINAAAPHQLAVVGGDPWVRLYDRRRLTLGAPGSLTSPAAPMLTLSAPHLPIMAATGPGRRAHATHVNFSARGDRLVAAFHGDHAYIWDVRGAPSISVSAAAAAGGGAVSPGCTPLAMAGFPVAAPVSPAWRRHRTSRGVVWGALVPPQSCYYPTAAAAVAAVGASSSPSPSPSPAAAAAAARMHQAHSSSAAAGSALPPAAETAKVAGNSALFEQRYSEAARCFSTAIYNAPWAASLYAQRALALLKRGWVGDAAAALADCEAALMLLAHQLKRNNNNSSSSSSSSSGGGGSGGGGFGAVEQQARLRGVHALKQLGQYKCALAALQDYTALFPSAAGGMEVSSLASWLQGQVQQQSALRRRQRDQRTALFAREAARRAAADLAVNGGSEQQQQRRRRRRQRSTAARRQEAGVTSHNSGSDAASADSSDSGGSSSFDEHRNVSDSRSSGGSSSSSSSSSGGNRRGSGSRSSGSDSDEAALSSSSSDCLELLLPWYGAAAHAQRLRSVAEVAQQQEAAATATAALLPSSAGGSVVNTAAATAQCSRRRPRSAGGSSGSDAGPGERMRSVRGGRAAAAAAAAGGSSPSGSSPPHADSTAATARTAAASAAFAAAVAAGVLPPPPPSLSPPVDTGSRRGHHRRRRRRRGRNQVTEAAAAAPSVPQRSAGSWWAELSGGQGRLLQRCVGGCNVQTDIKEAVFLGVGDELVAVGSDDGRVYIHCSATGDIVKVLEADEDVANCVRCHPSLPVLATSGIESVVRLWAPTAPVSSLPQGVERLVAECQSRTRAGPQLLRGALPAGALQVALEENPHLLQLLMGSLYGAGAAAGRGGVGPAAAGGEGDAAGSESGDGSGAGDGDSSDGSGRRAGGRRGSEVACRVS